MTELNTDPNMIYRILTEAYGLREFTGLVEVVSINFCERVEGELTLYDCFFVVVKDPAFRTVKEIIRGAHIALMMPLMPLEDWREREDSESSPPRTSRPGVVLT